MSKFMCAAMQLSSTSREGLRKLIELVLQELEAEKARSGEPDTENRKDAESN
jgi:hypothetical protein